MKVTREKVENSQAYLTVEMEPAEMETGLEASYRRLVQKTNIPGFRKGKAPRSVAERFLGKERLLEDAIDHLLPQAYEQALKEQEITPYAQPEVDISQTDPLIFKAIVPLPPEVVLGSYRDIRLEPEKVDITDEKVEAVVEELRHQHATWEPVERALDYNDMATINIDGTVEDKPYVKRVGTQYPVQKESISPAPGFADQIVGMKKDEEKEFTLAFPEDYPNKTVAGKEGKFKVKLTEIKEEKLPEVNDELAGQVSPEFKTLADLREEIVKSLKLRGEEQARMDFEEKLINTVVEQSEVSYPPVLITMEVNRIVNEQARQLQMSGQGMDQYLASINKTAEQLHEDLKPVATKNVTASLVLTKISEVEKIEVTEEEIRNGIENMARGVPEERRDELKKMLDTPQTRESISQQLKTRKTIERLSDIAKNKAESPEETKEEDNEPSTVKQPADE